MNRRSAVFAIASAALATVLAACAPFGMDASKTIVMFDGKSISNWNQVGDANWRVAEGMIQADKGNGFLVTKESYGNFYMTAEFWSEAETNSGIFIRMSNPTTITASNSYEVNIFDKRPNQAFGTGAIVGIAEVSPMPWAVGRWNTMEITARGTQLQVSMNGARTVDVRDGKHARGPISLQHGSGGIKFRNLQITPL